MWYQFIKAKKGIFRSIFWFTVPQDMHQANNSKSVKKINHSFKTLLAQFIPKSLLNFKIIAIPFTPAFFKMLSALYQDLCQVSQDTNTSLFITQNRARKITDVHETETSS
ncbi:hypothetical protein HMPREF1544_03028 [Mucor circinelloides 1006PhL]|uniref:Uncharacterized protein n=1 Tax=Mucor circinelloides f. circinelloides (strain 1006PhL) TaxID=1220926 RepID=S2JJS2_MUCC1|nr:hypothetical protein HMPREF1544_03028 [Mucor circinelloides 1006PhL]